MLGPLHRPRAWSVHSETLMHSDGTRYWRSPNNICTTIFYMMPPKFPIVDAYDSSEVLKDRCEIPSDTLEQASLKPCPNFLIGKRLGASFAGESMSTSINLNLHHRLITHHNSRHSPTSVHHPAQYHRITDLLSTPQTRKHG